MAYQFLSSKLWKAVTITYTTTDLQFEYKIAQLNMHNKAKQDAISDLMSISSNETNTI